MGSDVVSIRVEALGVSITIADGSSAITQTKAVLPATAAFSEVENPATASRLAYRNLLEVRNRASPTSGAVPASGQNPSIDELEQALPQPSSGRNGPSRPAEAKPVPPWKFRKELAPVRAKRLNLIKRNRYGAMTKSRG